MTIGLSPNLRNNTRSAFAAAVKFKYRERSGEPEKKPKGKSDLKRSVNKVNVSAFPPSSGLYRQTTQRKRRPKRVKRPRKKRRKAKLKPPANTLRLQHSHY